MIPSFTPVSFSPETAARNRNEARQLIHKLNDLFESSVKKGGVKKSTHQIANTSIPIHSWKFNEFDYVSNSVKLPTNARGLFTLNDEEIVVRGYDKFFNLGECSTTSKQHLSTNTAGPYTLTIKSNGCIVFVSGLNDGTLVVCSKHSTGLRDDVSKSHSVAAQSYLEQQLQSIGISTQELGLTLYELGVTAVAEYCDDLFEEHVLEYVGAKAGLYLHGLNFNTVDFKTYPMDQVNAFGDYFGFKRTEYLVMDTFDETMAFLEELAKTGMYKNDEIEGFVVRCFMMNGNDYFFKFKFEEPYLLYRQLREVTKQYIVRGYDKLNITKHKLICMDYLKFVIPIFDSNPHLKDEYLQGKGIVSLRKQYLLSKGTTGLSMISEEMSVEQLEQEMKRMKFQNQPCRYALVTLATIGCGKTTTAQTLCDLFPDLIGSVQSDNIPNPIKDKQVARALEMMIDKQVVILDRNNHKYVEREQIFQYFRDLNKLIPADKLKIICLNFISGNQTKYDKDLWELTRDRVVSRGDNHQSIKVIKEGVDKAEGIMKGFISRFQPFNSNKEPDSLFDGVIELNVQGKDSSLENCRLIVEYLLQNATDLPITRPTDEQYQTAFQKALHYEPVIHKFIKTTSSQRQQKPSYYFITIPDPSPILRKLEALSQSGECDFYNTLKATERVQVRLHVTLFHSATRKASKELKELWNKYNTECFKEDLTQIIASEVDLKLNPVQKLPSNWLADIVLEKLLWNGKLMCIKVSITRIYKSGDVDANLLQQVGVGSKFPHITIGTLNTDVKPRESNELLSSVYEFGNWDGISGLDFEDGYCLIGLPILAHY